MPITPLDPFWFSNRGLPTVFDQEIDYFTILSQLRGKINETITLIDELESEVTSMSSEFESIKSRLTAVETKLDTIEAELKAYIDSQLEGVEERLDEKLEAYKAEIAKLKENMPTDLAIGEHENLHLVHDDKQIGEGVEILMPTQFEELDGSKDGIIDVDDVEPEPQGNFIEL